MVFVSTPLGTRPSGEYAYLKETFGGEWLPFLVAWLKSIAYLGALAYLAQALADYSLELVGAFVSLDPALLQMPVALAGILTRTAVLAEEDEGVPPARVAAALPAAAVVGLLGSAG